MPKDIQVYLKVGMTSLNTDPVVSVLWEQIEPEVATLGADNSIFVQEDLVYKNTDAVIPVKASSFNFMSSKQPVKVKATVTTEEGLVNYDIYEFYLNDPPVAGTFTAEVVWSEDGEDDFESIKSFWAIELTEFYDDSDDEE